MNALLNRLQAGLRALDDQALRRRRRTVHTRCAPHTDADGQPLLAFCSNDYLGLASHPAIVEALQEGAARYGAGSGASHLISGHGLAHARLEEELAAFMAPHLEMPRALLFSTGYMANLAVLSALGGRDAELFSEELNHASLIDGARLSRSEVKVYAHGDIAALEVLLKASRAPTRIVVTDSVFSMDGDIAPLPQLLALCERHGAWLVVDDAHGFGMLGAQGRGALEHFNLRSPQLVYVGTLGKAAGVSGAFVAAHDSVIEWLVQRARPYIYTTASPPALAHALSASLALIAGAQRPSEHAGDGLSRRVAAQALATDAVRHRDPAGVHRRIGHGAGCQRGIAARRLLGAGDSSADSAARHRPPARDLLGRACAGRHAAPGTRAAAGGGGMRCQLIPINAPGSLPAPTLKLARPWLPAP
jgi:8-amino-7-oxononanoate synthase